MGSRIKANEVIEERYFKMPKAFFTEDKYKKMSLEAKVIYAFLKDRGELSLKNNWIDEEGSVYLIYTRKDIKEMLSIADKTVTKAFKQLVEYELIEEKRQGISKPNLIYVCHLNIAEISESIESYNLRFKSRKNYDSRVVKNTIQESYNLRANDTNISDTEKNNTDISIGAKETKHKYGEFNHVKLTDKEYSKLIEDFGEDKIKLFIKKVDEYCEQYGKSYKNYNLTIRKWISNDKDNKNNFNKGGFKDVAAGYKFDSVRSVQRNNLDIDTENIDF
ncbi:MAG: replication initiator protein A [Bacillota bacterium]|nr:replication initiator protein A [Bacillota bacterium]